ncbi:S8 family peptidase [Halobacterium salinarum]|uniref:S8 family peptidase n=1 Tax=Halobacterium salinarum TaxID=2242 RepID=UPI001F46C347|nr:S8 family peptidase [Halobacterium salinarum]MCF2207980.1 S8 family peptidase [Halobacterium salinarum]MCF2240564.1 S8 family serine peptidase [Halobacterium salinarum]MDL0124777.1 S8 family peptidase [Halobacterium salinarum]
MADNTNVTRRSFLTATGAAAGSVALVGVSAGESDDPWNSDRSEYIVGVSNVEDDPQQHVEQYLQGQEQVGSVQERLNTAVVGLPADAPESVRKQFVDRLESRDTIKYVEQNVELQAQLVPNDPRFGDQYADQQVNAPEAWDTTTGDAGVTIGVVDQGVKYDHPDLDGNIDRSVSNGGRDFVDDDGDPYPDSLNEEIHGTHVAGIAAAEVNNGNGVTGIGNSSVIAGRALSERGSGSTADIADAITWAANEGADVINLSLGGGGYTNTMQNAVTYAANQGALVVAAAGNDGSGSVSYPAAYGGVLAVSALDPDESLASYSNYGPKIDLAAPGTNVLSTWTADDYESISGTSMATPVVAGVAGLTLAQWELSNAELRNHLKATAVDIGLSDRQQGAGRVDAANAVNTDPGSGGGGGGGGGDSTSSSVSGSLRGRGDSNCWSFSYEYSNPSQVVIELDGPGNADFDLYANTSTNACPTTSSYEFRSWTTGSQESITIDNPDTSVDLNVLAYAYSGRGDLTVTVTEYK